MVNSKERKEKKHLGTFFKRVRSWAVIIHQSRSKLDESVRPEDLLYLRYATKQLSSQSPAHSSGKCCHVLNHSRTDTCVAPFYSVVTLQPIHSGTGVNGTFNRVA